MQRLALLLAAVVQRRRSTVVAAWAVLMVVSIPCAARQTEHLTGNGFNVAGSQSETVRETLNRDFPPAMRSQLAVVLVPGDQAGAASVRDAVLRIDAAAARTPHVELSPDAERPRWGKPRERAR